MKKIVLLFVFLAASVVSYAQYTVTPQGLVADSGKSFDVYFFEGFSQDSLYNNVYKYITRSFVSPKDVISPQKPDIISLNALMPIKRNNPISQAAWINVTISFEFKDAKIRVNMPEINRIFAETSVSDIDYYFVQPSWIQENGIYSAKGKLKDAIMKSSIEDALNGFIKSLLAQISATDSEW